MKNKKLNKIAWHNYRIIDEVIDYLIDELDKIDKEFITEHENPTKNITKSIELLIKAKGEK